MFEKKEKRSVTWKRLGRLLVCLVLVCVILIDCSPIRAKAVEPVTMVMVSAATVIASVVIGLGVMMGSDPVVFDQLVEKISQDEEVSDIISVDFKLPVIKYNATTGGVDPDRFGWAAGWTLIEAIRQVLFREGVVPDDISTVAKTCLYNEVELPALPYRDVLKFPYAYIGSTMGYYLVFSTKPLVEEKINGTSGGINTGSESADILKYLTYGAGGSWSLVGELNIPAHEVVLDVYTIWSNENHYYDDGSFYLAGTQPVPVSYTDISKDLTFGEIAPQEQELSEGYIDWYSGSFFDLDSNEYWFPVGLGQTYDETKTYTQKQVQAGEGTYIVADSPVYDTNLPLAGSLTYERFATAQPLTVSAAVTDGGTIRYEWFRYQMEPSLGSSESLGGGLSIVPETSNTGKWMYYCKATNTVNGVSSLPVTSNYVTVTIIDPNEQENPDISPTEAPGVDPDPGGDPDPGVDPDIDPDNQTDLENSGNENVDHLIEIIPDHSGEFGEALKALADSMSYEGTDAILTIPQVNFPALGNLVPGFVMMQEQQINFADYVEMMPSNLLLLVRCLLTAALIMYCFYELYSTFEYVLVLRRD